MILGPTIRRLLLGAAIACAWPGLSAHATGPADGPGCLGVNVEECVRWLRATMVLDETFLADAMARRHQVDVNGRPIGGGFLTVNARLTDAPDQFVILLHLNPDDTVRSADSNLLYNILQGSTERVYDYSRVFDIVWRLLGRRCPNLVKLELYRFFENSLKPRVVQTREDFSGGLLGLHRIYSRAVGVPYCGVNFTYTNRLEWRGTSELKAARNIGTFTYIELQ